MSNQQNQPQSVEGIIEILQKEAHNDELGVVFTKLGNDYYCSIDWQGGEMKFKLDFIGRDKNKLIKEGTLANRIKTLAWWVKHANSEQEAIETLNEFLSHQQSAVLEAVRKMIESKKEEIYNEDGEGFGWDLISEIGYCCPGDDATNCYERALDDVLKSLPSLSNNKS